MAVDLEEEVQNEVQLNPSTIRNKPSSLLEPTWTVQPTETSQDHLALMKRRSMRELNWFRRESKESKDRRLEEFQLTRKDNKQYQNKNVAEATQSGTIRKEVHLKGDKSKKN